MKSIHSWLDEYGESHQNHTNKTLHWICVPLIVMSIVGLFWAIPTPDSWKSLSFPLNWGTIFLAGAMIYYSILSPALMVGMLFVASGFVAANYFIAESGIMEMWAISLIIFAGAWVGQFIGHKIEGKKPSFFKDIQFLMIGPLWLLSFIYRSLGIKY